MYLIDTNVWLERLLGQARSDEVGQLFNCVTSDDLSVTDFAFHSIGVILKRLDRAVVLLSFVRDTFVEGSVTLVRLEPADMPGLVRVADRFNLDFDDAYQYVAAEIHDLTLVSFDSDFDRTDRGRKTPAQVLTELSRQA